MRLGQVEESSARRLLRATPSYQVLGKSPGQVSAGGNAGRIWLGVCFAVKLL